MAITTGPVVRNLSGPQRRKGSNRGGSGKVLAEPVSRPRTPGVPRRPAKKHTFTKILTVGERYRIERARLKEDQHAAAARLGVPRSRYQLMEKDSTPGEKMGLEPHEWCRVMRWRCKKSQREVAADLGVTRYWVNRMEIGEHNCDTLIWYWEQ